MLPKHQGGSAEFTKSAFNFKDRQIYLAKCTEPLPIRCSRQIPEGCEPSTVTVILHPYFWTLAYLNKI
jgi:putative transposase